MNSSKRFGNYSMVNNGKSQQGEMDDPALDLSFTLPEERRLQLTDYEQSDAKRFLSFELCRDPENLKQHVQRIMLQISSGDSERLFGALLDLFIVLGDKGEDLRKRLLKYAEPLLVREDYDYLVTHQGSELTKQECRMNVKGSVLNAGFSGSANLVERHQDEAGYDDPLQEALSLIEYGQVSEARDVLEKAFTLDPRNSELEEELIGIYRSTRDYTGYEAMSMKLNSDDIPHSDKWKALGQELAAT